MENTINQVTNSLTHCTQRQLFIFKKLCFLSGEIHEYVSSYNNT